MMNIITFRHKLDCKKEKYCDHNLIRSKYENIVESCFTRFYRKVRFTYATPFAIFTRA